LRIMDFKDDDDLIEAFEQGLAIVLDILEPYLSDPEELALFKVLKAKVDAALTAHLYVNHPLN